MTRLACLACGSALTALPVPHPTQSVLSDGRVILRPLAKSHCPTCGLISHLHAPDIETIRDFYDDAYDLAVEVAPSDVPRTSAYADFLVRMFPGAPPRRVLEIGCGAGHTLDALAAAWPGADCFGYEAAPAVARAAQRVHDRVTVHQGFIEDVAEPKTGFDLVFSVNVFEHAADPVQFLTANVRQLAPGGSVVVVCPAAMPPNLELVFQDHIHTFTLQSARLLAPRAGLQVVHHEPHPDGLGDFQMFEFRAQDADPVSEGLAPPATEGIVAYLDTWSGLDDALLQRSIPGRASDPDVSDAMPGAGSAMRSRLLIFGAGEMAALLRAYAPRTWANADTLVVDDVSGARALGLPVQALTDANPGPGDTVLIATHPRSQAAVAARLAKSGATCVTFHDLIPG